MRHLRHFHAHPHAHAHAARWPVLLLVGVLLLLVACDPTKKPPKPEMGPAATVSVR